MLSNIKVDQLNVSPRYSINVTFQYSHIAQIPYPSPCDVELLVTALTVSHFLVWCPLPVPLCNIPRYFLFQICNLKLWYAQLITKFFQCLFLFSALFLQLIVSLLQRNIFLPRDITISSKGAPVSRSIYCIFIPLINFSITLEDISHVYYICCRH